LSPLPYELRAVEINVWIDSKNRGREEDEQEEERAKGSREMGKKRSREEQKHEENEWVRRKGK
jgi:hypothetical protein